MYSSILALSCLSATALAASPDEWRGRSIYQVLTDRFARTDGSTTAPCNVFENKYCGGTWKGIQNKLDYIQGMGFSAIWISPITKNTPEGYHGYYQTNLYDINENFGTAQDLKDLSAAMKAKGMYLMVDVVTNHFGSSTGNPNIPYSSFYPFNDQKYFHDYCDIDYNNQNSAEVCWLYDNLPDVRTEDQDVVDAFSDWISYLVKEYDIDGLRIDSVKDVNKESMPPFCQAAGVYCLGELSNNDFAYSDDYQQYLNGGGIINYPLWFAFNETFVYDGYRNMETLAYNIYQNKQMSLDSNLHGTWTENHDNPRIAWHNSDFQVAANSLGWTMLTDGIPIVYYGQEQHLAGEDDPGCREAMWLEENGSYSTSTYLHGVTAYLNQIRNWAVSRSSGFTSYKTIVLNYSQNQLSLRKDVIRTILTFAGENQGSGQYTTSGAGFSSGETVVDLINCNQYNADGNGEVTANVGGGVMVVMMPKSFLSGSGMCGL